MRYRGGDEGDDDDVDEEGTGGPETGAPTEVDGRELPPSPLLRKLSGSMQPSMQTYCYTFSGQ